MNSNEARALLDIPPNLTVIVKDVGNECYRVNVFTSITTYESMIPKLFMCRSHYVRLIDGKYTDCTK